jgi:hypothetical protein
MDVVVADKVEALKKKRMGPPGPCSSQSGSRYSMSRICGPRDIISLVIPRLGDNSTQYLLSPTLGIIKEITSRGPRVLDMEYREPDDLSMAPEGPSFLQCNPFISNSNIHPTSLFLKKQ